MVERFVPQRGTQGITKEIRAHVNVEFQKWILDHNLLRAFNFRESAIQIVRIYDNSARFVLESLSEAMTAREGQVTHLANPAPSWLEDILKGTKYDLSRVKHELSVQAQMLDHGPER